MIWIERKVEACPMLDFHVLFGLIPVDALSKVTELVTGGNAVGFDRSAIESSATSSPKGDATL